MKPSHPFENTPVISSYPQQAAIEDGMLVELFKSRWSQLSGGKPILASSAAFGEFSLAAFQEVWNEFVLWKKTKEALLPVEDRLFKAKMNDQTLWVIEDGSAFTILFPSDY